MKSLMAIALATLLPAGGSAPVPDASDLADGGVLPDARSPYFVLESAVSVGNKGEETLDVAVDARCGHPVWLFDHAELNVTRNRFGDVQFVRLPQPGCTDCSPIVLRWFHEPTGYLAFEVNVFRRLEVIPCTNETASERG